MRLLTNTSDHPIQLHLTVDETAALFTYLHELSHDKSGMAYYIPNRIKATLAVLFDGYPTNTSDRAVTKAIEGYLGPKPTPEFRHIDLSPKPL